MKTLPLIIGMFALTGCWGNDSVNNEVICQPKKIHHNTPLICGNYDSVDVSLGVMRDGVGSMSTADLELAFDPANETANKATLEKAIAGGKLVKLTYNDRRFSWCQETPQVLTVEVVETKREHEDDSTLEKQKQKEDLQKKIDELNKQLNGN